MKKNHSSGLFTVAALLAFMCTPICARADTIYVGLQYQGTVKQFFTNGFGLDYTSTPLLDSVQGVAFDSSGNLYVADNFGGLNGNGLIEKFTPDGAASVFAEDPGDGSVLSGPEGLAFDSSGNLYVANDGGWIEEFDTDGTPSLFASDPGDGSVLSNPYGLVFDSAGNLYVANTYGGDNGNGTIEKFTPDGTPSLFASDSGDGSVLNFPYGLTIDSAGNLYVANNEGGTNKNGSIEKFTTSGIPSLFASDPGDGSILYNPFGLDFDSAGNLYVANLASGTIEKFDTDGNGSVFASGLNGPTGIVVQRVSSSGSLLISNLNVVARPNSAIITWTTSANATGQVQYGTTPAYGSFSALNANSGTNQAVLLTGLTTNTVYYFQAFSTHGNNLAVATSSFSTDVSLVVPAIQATYDGVWTLTTAAPDKYSTPYKYASTSMGADSAEAFFRPTIVIPGYYDVYVWYSSGTNRSTNVPVLISYQSGSVSTNICQTFLGGNWQLLTTSQYFAAGTNSFVRIGNGTGEKNKVVIADAVRWVYSAGQDSPTNGTVPAWWSGFYFGTNIVDGSAPGSNGYSLFANYVIGLSPTNSSPGLNFSIAAIPSGFQATFSPWQGGRAYGLQSATTLRNPIWTAVPNLTASETTNGQGVIVNTNTGGGQKFYRLSVQLLP